MTFMLWSSYKRWPRTASWITTNQFLSCKQISAKVSGAFFNIRDHRIYSKIRLIFETMGLIMFYWFEKSTYGKLYVFDQNVKQWFFEIICLLRLLWVHVSCTPHPLFKMFGAQPCADRSRWADYENIKFLKLDIVYFFLWAISDKYNSRVIVRKKYISYVIVTNEN